MAIFALHLRIARFSTAALMLAGVIAAASPALAEKVLRFANMGEPETLDPHKAAINIEANILINLFEGLVVQDPKGDVAPGVAESWSASTDGLIYTFHLRRNAKWSNGEPVTADDFVYSLRRVEDPKVNSQYAEVLYPIRNAEEVNTGKAELAALGVKAPDPATVEITLKAPTPYFLQLLTHSTAMPVNARNVAEFGAEWVRPGKMVSNGPYMLADARPGAHIRIVKNPSYWDAAHVTIDAVVFDPSEDRGSVLRRYRAGEFDVADDLPTDQLDWLRKNMPKDLHIAPHAAVYYLAFNVTKPPFNDVRVRQALTMAVNREVLVEKITLAGELPAYGFVPDGTANYKSQKFSWASMSQSAREAEALKLTRAAGYGPGKPLKFQLAYNTSENHKKIVVALAAMWKKLGVEVELVNSEVKVHFAKLRQNDFQLGRAGWIADYNDAQSYLFLAETSTKQHNYSRFSNPDYDQLMAQASLTSDLAARAQLLEQAETILLKEVPVLPLYFYVSKNLVSPKVSGWVANPLNLHNMRDLTLAD